jgi:hypothetical protein
MSDSLIKTLYAEIGEPLSETGAVQEITTEFTSTDVVGAEGYEGTIAQRIYIS